MKQNNSQFILAGNGPYDNRGCEAIVRGTAKIINHYFQEPTFLNFTHFRNDEQFRKQLDEEPDKKIISKKLAKPKKFTRDWLFYKIGKDLNLRTFGNHIYDEMIFHLNNSEAVLSIGGDSYSLDYGTLKLFTNMDDIVLRHRKPLVIWGASVGPFDRNPDYEKYMIGHLHKVTAIFARESATVEYLEKIGVTENVFSVADPAFLLDPKRPNDLKNNIEIEEGSVGLNLSPLMAKYVTDGDLNAWTEMASKIISAISDEFDCRIYLIPHVTNPNIEDNDYFFLRGALERTNIRNDKVSLIPPIYTAAETKWIIGQMHIFAGARTHSTIASLSSSVPTLSFAYSMKAKGINKDIFDHDFYCINPYELKPEFVVEKVQEVLDNYRQINKDLKREIPSIQKKALISGKYLKEVLNG